MRYITSYCGAKTRSKRIPDVDELAGWDVKKRRRIGYVMDISEDGETAVIHLFQTEHGPPTDPAEVIEKPMAELYRVCSQPSLPGRTHRRCHYHQGGPGGPRNGNFKHGGYSSHLPTRIAADFEEVRANPELAELDNDIALVHTRILDLLDRTERGESGDLWTKLHSAAATFSEAVRMGKVGEVKTAVAQIYEITEKGRGDMEVWGEIMELVDTKRRLVEATARIAEKRQTAMTIERAYTLLAYVEAGLRRSIEAHVADEITRDLIAESFSDYMRMVYHGGKQTIPNLISGGGAGPEKQN